MPFQLEVIGKYRQRGVLVDSSLLVVYLVGLFDPLQLHNCRAIKSSFTRPEFELLAELIGAFERIITTPHVLTEVSNLAGRLPQRMHGPFRSFFSEIIGKLEEETRSARQIAGEERFVRFGLTDTALMLIAPGNYLVLTEELALYEHLSRAGVDVINFNHIRLAA